MTTETHLKHLFDGVPFHELEGKDISQMNEKELEALIKTTRAVRVAPSVKKKLRTTATREITGKKKTITAASADLSHLM